MIPYNEGLFDGILSAFHNERLDAEDTWSLLGDNFFDKAEDNLINIHVTDWLDYEKKVEMIMACPNKAAVGKFLETYEGDYEDNLQDIYEEIESHHSS